MSPNLEGPLMSIGAHGTIAKALTYSMRGGKARVAIYRPPPDARTQAQLNQRAHYLDGARLWKLMTDADRLAWTQTHQLPNASGYNTFVQTIINRITRRRHWLHEAFFSQDVALQNFIMIQLMENHAGSVFQDISGTVRDWSPGNTTQEQGDRGQCASITDPISTHTVDNGTNLGHLTAFTLALRTHTATAQPDLGGTVRLIGAYSYGAQAGFMLAYRTTDVWFRVGENNDSYTVIAPTLYTPNMWNNLVATFDADDSGRVKIFLNGAEIANVQTGMSRAANTGENLYLGGTPAGAGFPGRIDNAILYKGASSALRI